MRKIGPIIGLTALAEPALAADLATIDWSKVPVANVTLFYPGQSSYEWWRTSDHRGSKFRSGWRVLHHLPQRQAKGAGLQDPAQWLTSANDITV